MQYSKQKKSLGIFVCTGGCWKIWNFKEFPQIEHTEAFQISSSSEIAYSNFQCISASIYSIHSLVLLYIQQQKWLMNHTQFYIQFNILQLRLYNMACIRIEIEKENFKTEKLNTIISCLPVDTCKRIGLIYIFLCKIDDIAPRARGVYV